MKTNVVIVGCGTAGLFTALSLPKDKQILLLCKDKKENSNSYLAQGGLSTLRDPLDFDAYFEDTMKAGHFENSKDAVAMMIEKSKGIVEDLIEFSVDFEKQDGEFLYTCEAAHSSPRILFHKDITGKEIVSKLLDEAEKRDNIKILEHCSMLDIIVEDNQCCGIIAKNESDEVFTILADYTVWATGGIGGLYKHSTNFKEIKGDAIAIALKWGINLKDIDYVQTHPTTFYSKKKGRRFLITESVRGEGGILYNKNMERFTNELLPRDVLTQAIYKQMKEDNQDFVWLSFENIPEKTIHGHFPNIYSRMKEEGFDITKQPIPIVPSQHYYMGGVAVDLHSKTSMNRLYAVGETSCTGVHGANRLASNSLLECMVFGKQASNHIMDNYNALDITPSVINLSEVTNVSTDCVLIEIEKNKKKGRIVQYE